jgi:mitogen-activated protein kinase kinase kinase
MPNEIIDDDLDNNINGETLLECDHGVLKELGISKVGDRVRIFSAVKTLRAKTFGNGKKRNRVRFPHGPL